MSRPVTGNLDSWSRQPGFGPAKTGSMTTVKGDDFRFSGIGDATPGLGCSIIWQEDFYEQQYFSRSSGEISWGQELMTDDRVHSVRISRG